MGVRTAKEMAEAWAADRARRPEREWWGPWRLRRESFVLEFYEPGRSGSSYEVPLDNAASCAGLLDTIVQVFEKTWSTPEVMTWFLAAINDLIHPQSSLCSMGVDRGRIDVQELLRAGNWLPGDGPA